MPTKEKMYLLPEITLQWILAYQPDTHLPPAIDFVFSEVGKHPVNDYVLRSDWDFVNKDKQRCVKLIEEVYALLVDDKPNEAKELLQKRVNNMNVDIPVFISKRV